MTRMKNIGFAEWLINCGLAIFLLAGLWGCGGLPSLGVASIPAYPIAGDENKIQALRSKYSQADFDAVLRVCVDDPCRKQARNLILEELMLIVDHGYHRYEGNLIAGRAKWKFGLGTTTQALSLAATASTVETSKTIFSIGNHCSVILKDLSSV